MLEQANDFLEECRAVKNLLTGLPDAAWETETQFKGWTITDVIGHLHLFDVAAGITLESREALQAFFKKTTAGRDQGITLVSFTRQWLGDCRGAELLDRWYSHAEELARRYLELDPGLRVAWGGPDMSVRSCISARQMETWAHSQAVFDCLGETRPEGDRIRNIAIMGINTFGWSFVNRGLEVPANRPTVLLKSPSGETWEWLSEDQDNQVIGNAVDFCRVVTQTRHYKDTQLQLTGPLAQKWMSIAQCFAGPAEDPPAPGTRFKQGK